MEAAKHIRQIGRAGYHYLSLVLVLMLFCSPLQAQETEQVVLVTHRSSAAETVSLLDIRRLYLGFPSDNPYIGKPVINRSSQRIFEDFLKNVMHVTEDGYRRKIVRRVFRYGSDYVTELESIAAIAQHLENYPHDVVFVKKSDLIHLDGVKILVRLW